VYWEILASVIFVLGGTFLAYGQLSDTAAFWNAQSVWSTALIVSWTLIAAAYYYEGWLIHHGRSQANISAVTPALIFVAQCILFIKGIFFNDWSLVFGALLVNSGVVFCLYQISKRKRWIR
ncbi:MAG: hypothetical protein AAB665_01605, partial [Patescibacteria group bacterium]